MAVNEERPSESTSSQPSISPAPPPRPTITPPQRTSFEALFNGGGAGSGFVGFSPGPMTLVSSFFSDGDDCKSFSQLLAGAMASPAAAPAGPSLLLTEERTAGGSSVSVDGGADDDFRLKQNRPSELVTSQSPVFAGGLPDSLGLFSPGLGPFGMTHQQALVQVSAQAAQANSNMPMETEYVASLSAAPAATLTQPQAFSSNTTTQQEVPSLMPDSSIAMKESSDFSHQDLKSQSSSFDKPNDDGYNWRKYGQKQVKGSEFPRSYYKCTHPNCPVKKKVERSLEGQVTEIIYKGEHNHQRPKPNKRGKDVGNSNGNSSTQGNRDLVSQVQSGYFNKSTEGTSSYSISRMDQESSQATNEHLSGTSDSGGAVVGVEEKDEDEPEPKRRSTEVRHLEAASSHKTVTEPRIIVQTTSEVDLLDDGYRWRKYGQKVVKGNPYPRSYYKCTTTGCNVRKHVERASSDSKAVITTYEGKHNHDVPASKTSSHNTANNSSSNQRLQGTRTENHGSRNPMGQTDNGRKPIGHLRLKEEQIT